MNRRSLLIDAGRACPEDIVDGCRADVVQIKAWLESAAGGAWDEEPEICWLHNQSLATIKQGVKWVSAADFAFVAFSGHGEINEVNGKRSQQVYVGEGTCELIDFDLLKPKTGKSIVICDACRKVHVKSEIVKLFVENMQKFARVASQATRYSRDDYKHEYLRLLGEADGRYTMFSCSPNQYSGDHKENGGRFTSALLTCARQWYAENEPNKRLRIGQAFGLASPMVSNTSREQNPNYPQDPEAYPEIRGVSSKYPFAIRLG